MKYLLALEASTKVASVALAAVSDATSTILVDYTTDIRKTHSQRLLPMVDQVLREAGLRPVDLGAVACTTGPGSFTGLRIGLATAKGLAFALNIPAFGVPTLDALANNLGLFEPGAPRVASSLVCPVLDARKGQVYAQIFLPVVPGASGERSEVRSEGPLAVSPEELLEMLTTLAAGVDAMSGDMVFLGDGTSPSAGLWPLIERTFGARARLAPTWLRYPRATSVAALAAHRWAAGASGSLEELQPAYLRPSEAEVKLAQGRELVP